MVYSTGEWLKAPVPNESWINMILYSPRPTTLGEVDVTLNQISPYSIDQHHRLNSEYLQTHSVHHTLTLNIPCRLMCNGDSCWQTVNGGEMLSLVPSLWAARSCNNNSCNWRCCCCCCCATSFCCRLCNSCITTNNIINVTSMIHVHQMTIFLTDS